LFSIIFGVVYALQNVFGLDNALPQPCVNF